MLGISECFTFKKPGNVQFVVEGAEKDTKLVRFVPVVGRPRLLVGWRRRLLMRVVVPTAAA